MNNQLALIIEDDPYLSDIFARALRAAEFDIEIVQDGQQALTRLNETQPIIVILDLHLPHVSGDKILQRIRTDPRLVQTRVIITSADHILADSLKLDADLVLVKPVSFIQLRDLAIRLRPSDTTGTPSADD